MARGHCCEVRLTKVGPRRYHARVDCCIDMLTGYDDDLLGASSEGETPAEAIENASERVIALAAAHPELAAMLTPLVGPQMGALLVAARYLNAPEVIRDVADDAVQVVKEFAKDLRPVIRTAQKTGRSVGKIGKKVGRAASAVGRALGKLW